MYVSIYIYVKKKKVFCFLVVIHLSKDDYFEFNFIIKIMFNRINAEKAKEAVSKVQEKFHGAVESAQKISKQIIRHTLADAVRDYIASTLNNTTDEFCQKLINELQDSLNQYKDEEKGVLVQQVIFVNLLGYDTNWADFMILEVMSQSDYSLKRICYTASGFLWNPNSDAVLMATNRVHKDLTTVQPLVTSVVLSGISTWLSEPLAQHIASDIISLMSSARPDVKQKAICVFYQVCLKYPDALKAGFPSLKARLDDSDPSVLFTALNVMAEFCKHNPSNFVSLIPKFFKMLETSPNNWCTLKLIYLLRMLCDVEPRLPKKLINPFTNVLETTASVTVLFECVRTIIEVPITNTVLLTYATQRMQNFIEHQDANLRFLCLSLFIKLMEIQPKLVAQHKEIISQCLDSNDEATRLLALDLLAALANRKTIDGIVAKMFVHFKDSLSTTFKDTIIKRVIEVCSKNDYSIITDFDWYISILGDFIQEGGFTCTELVADQFMDLATRVPSTRPSLVEEMGKILAMRNYRDATKLLLAALYIIAEYSENSNQLPIILTPNILYCDERVQVSALSTAFKLYVKCESQEAFEEAEKLFEEELPSFQTGIYAEVQDIAVMTLNLINVLKTSRESEAFQDLKNRLTEEYDEDNLPELEVPEELNEPDDDFKGSSDDDFLEEHGEVDELVEATAAEIKKQVKKEERHRRVKPKVRKQKQTTDRDQVVIKKSKKSLLANQIQEKKQNPIADAFANIDLTNDEPAVAVAPKPYGQPKAPVVLEKPKADEGQKPKLRAKRVRHTKKTEE